jgi:hypothetical protein
MGGVAMISLRFSGSAPNAREVVAEAERIGGVALVATERVEIGQTIVRFQAFPQGQVTVSQRSYELFIADYSLVAPALYRLLWQASEQLGAGPKCSDPLPLPLSEDFVHRYNTRSRRLASTAGVVLVLLAIAVIAGIAGLVSWVASAA